MNITNTDDVMDLIEQVAALPGKNDKIATLKAHAGSDLLKRVLAAAYDPLVSYGIRAFPERKSPEDKHGWVFDSEEWTVIEGLAKRTLTGGAAIATIQSRVDVLSAKSAELFKRIILKDMRAGFSEETCNKVWPKLLADFPYMRCCLPKDSKMTDWLDIEGGISQEKADGMFLNVDHEESGEVFLYSRSGSMFPMDKFGMLAPAVKSTLDAGTQTHGELLVMGTRPDGSVGVLAREIGNGILNKILQGGDWPEGTYPVLMVWDQIPRSAVVAKGSCTTPYKERLAGLIKQVRAAGVGPITIIPTRIVKSTAAAYEHAGELMLQDKEGTIVKRMSAIWKDGTSKEQVKLKLEFEVDLEITAILPGEDNTKNEGRPGRLACASSDNLLQVNVAVKNEAMRAALEAAPHDWIGQIMPVTANLIMKPSDSNPLHSLFLPRFSQDTYRTDKTAADSLPTITATQEAAKLGQKLKHDAEKKAA
jgi:DNA ligase-1